MEPAAKKSCSSALLTDILPTSFTRILQLEMCLFHLIYNLSASVVFFTLQQVACIMNLIFIPDIQWYPTGDLFVYYSC